MERIFGELREEALGKLSEVVRAVVGGRVHPRILQALINGDEVEVVRILSLSALAAREKPTQGQFNGLVNEMVVWELLGQIDALAPDQRKKLQPFLSELWANEEQKSDINYPEGFRIRTPQEQLDIWLQHFPELDSSDVLDLTSAALPEGAEGWGVVPKPEMIIDFGSVVYHQAFDKVLTILAGQRTFKNWREGALGPDHLQLVRRTAMAHEDLNQLSGGFWVFPFQFGRRWAGKSVRRGRILYAESEFGLGPYKSAALLVTHPDRITGLGQLYVDCSGCVYSPDADGQFGRCLRFGWFSGHDPLYLDYCSIDYADSYFGSLSGFLPSRPQQ